LRECAAASADRTTDVATSLSLQPFQRIDLSNRSSTTSATSRPASPRWRDKKHLVIFTEGFDSTRITDIKAKGRPPNIESQLLNLVKTMHEAFLSAGVTLDAVDIKGLRHAFSDLENDGLYMVARDTGGRVIANRNDLVKAVDTLMKAQRVAYILGFHQGNREQGRVTVRVTGAPRGSEVSYREGFGFASEGRRSTRCNSPTSSSTTYRKRAYRFNPP
jgi:hypothetical protein